MVNKTSKQDNKVDRNSAQQYKKKQTYQTTRGKKKEKYKSGKFLEAALNSKCCARKCLAVLSAGTIQECLRGFWERTEESQRAFIIDYLHFAGVPCENRTIRYEYRVNGQNVCQKAWRMCYGISTGRYVRIPGVKGRQTGPTLNLTNLIYPIITLKKKKLWDIFSDFFS